MHIDYVEAIKYQAKIIKDCHIKGYKFNKSTQTSHIGICILTEMNRIEWPDACAHGWE